MQYLTGTINLTNGSNVVTGVGTTWITDSDPVEAGDELSVIGSGVFFQIQTVDSDTQLHLTANYMGVTATLLTYLITRDWTPNNLPVLQRGDVDVANVVGRMTNGVDALVTAIQNGTLKPFRYDVTTSSVTLNPTYNYHRINNLFGGAITVNPPVIHVPNWHFVVRDYSLTAGALNLIFGGTLDGGTSVVIVDSNGGSAEIFDDGTIYERLR